MIVIDVGGPLDALTTRGGLLRIRSATACVAFSGRSITVSEAILRWTSRRKMSTPSTSRRRPSAYWTLVSNWSVTPSRPVHIAVRVAELAEDLERGREHECRRASSDGRPEERR